MDCGRLALYLPLVNWFNDWVMESMKLAIWLVKSIGISILPIDLKRLLPTIINNAQQPAVVRCIGSVICSRDQFKKVNRSWTKFRKLDICFEKKKYSSFDKLFRLLMQGINTLWSFIRSIRIWSEVHIADYVACTLAKWPYTLKLDYRHSGIFYDYVQSEFKD